MIGSGFGPLANCLAMSVQPLSHQYRLFPVNVAGHIAGAPDVIEATNDEQAVQAARRLAGNRSAEVWSGDRLVTALKPKRSYPQSTVTVLI